MTSPSATKHDAKNGAAATRTVLVLGANGALGRVTSEAFSVAGWSVHHGQRRPADRPNVRRVDLDEPATLASGFADVDLVINTIPDHDLRAEAAVAEHGGLLLNTAALPLADTQALEARVGPSQGLAVLHGGLVPGITSLVMADLLERHPGVDRLEMVWTLTAQGYSGVGGRLWAHHYVSGRGRHPTFRAALPAPYGTRTCLRVGDEERGWMVDIPDHVDVHIGLCFLERDTDLGFRVANRLGLLRQTPEWLFVKPPKYLTRGAVPGQGTAPPGACAYTINAYQGDLLVSSRRIECADDYLATAVATVALGEALLASARTAEATGVRSVEQLIALDDVTQTLARHDVRVVGA